MSVISTPSVASLLVPPVSGGQFAGAVLAVVTDSPPETGVVPRRGEGVDRTNGKVKTEKGKLPYPPT